MRGAFLSTKYTWGLDATGNNSRRMVWTARPEYPMLDPRSTYGDSGDYMRPRTAITMADKWKHVTPPWSEFCPPTTRDRSVGSIFVDRLEKWRNAWSMETVWSSIGSIVVCGDLICRNTICVWGKIKKENGWMKCIRTNAVAKSDNYEGESMLPELYSDHVAWFLNREQTSRRAGKWTAVNVGVMGIRVRR